MQALGVAVRNAETEANLFGRAGIDLPLQESPTEAGRVTCYFESIGPRLPISLRLRDPQGAGAELQGVLSFIAPLPPAAPQPEWLDFGVFDTFRDLTCARKAALALEARGIHRIAQLIEKTEGQLARQPGMDRGALLAIKARLSRVGLVLGRRMARRTLEPRRASQPR